VRVADAYDAMSTSRAYRAALDPDVVLNELIRMSNRQFDPFVVKAFVSTLTRKGENAAYNLDQVPVRDSEPALDLGQLARIG
jgi:HD-GYP domain-containing protein (c-di-GMP phosphodiesterase class II)